MNVNFDFEWDVDDVDDFLWNYDWIGYVLFIWFVLDGLLDVCDKWQSIMFCVMIWCLMLWMVDECMSGGSYCWNVVDKMVNVNCFMVEEIVDYWVGCMLNCDLDLVDYDEFVDFMVNGFGILVFLLVGVDLDMDV